MKPRVKSFLYLSSMAQNRATYPSGHHASVLRSHSWRTAANSAAYLLPSLKPHMSILDVGCGPGTITVDLAKYVPQGHITGVDMSHEVIAQAQENAQQRGSSNVEFEVGDVSDQIRFPAQSFDVVHVHQVLQHVGDPIHLLREMRRVTKPGGIVAAREADFASMTWYPDVDGMHAWLELWTKVARANGGEPNAGRRVHAWAREAGFEAAKIEKSIGTWCFSAPGDVQWWSDLWAERLVKSDFAKSAVDGGHATALELQRIAEVWKVWGSSEDAWFAVMHGEILCHV